MSKYITYHLVDICTHLLWTVQEDLHDSTCSEAPATPLSEASTPYSSNILSRNTSRSHSSARKRQGVPNDHDTTDVMKLVGKKLESLQEEDAFQLFGKHITDKLRRFPRSQNAIAQNLISDVLFEAELSTLTRNFQIVDMTYQRQDDFGSLDDGICAHRQSQPMQDNYVPKQNSHTQEYETIGQIQAVSRIIPREDEQDQPTHTHPVLAHSSTAIYLSTFQPNCSTDVTFRVHININLL
ncbi:hypothetical protein WA026_012725 [Henosepilachna vigintioctopunctata]|uniref:Uncharacterized protein n=1 Tax=Henosepilachna vigintioctopunctata TaxID=420089 RepID=A0AAW1U709_9CUCU